MPAPSFRRKIVTLLSCVLLIGSATASLPPVSFQTSPAPYIVGQGPFFVVAANLRPSLPGRQDLIVANSNVNGNNTPGNTITVLLNDGTGVYTQATGSPITVGNAPIGIAVDDFNRDGFPDLAVANTGDNTVSILTGKGDGTFNPPTTITAGIGSNPIGVFTADLNGDGFLDLVVTNSTLFSSNTCTGSSVSILLGNGSGGFTPATGSPLASGPCPLDAAIVDLGNGKLDLVVANDGGMNSTVAGSVSVFKGNGNGTFSARTDYAVGVQPISLAVADFGNGKLDVVVGDQGDTHGNTPGTDPGGISLLVGNGDGTLQASRLITTVPGVFSVTAADLNGDGKADLVTTTHNNGLNILFGTGMISAPFSATPVIYSVPGKEGFAAVGDLNGDGRPDVVVPDGNGNTLTVLLNQGNGTFPAPRAYPVGINPDTLAVGPLRQGNSKLDIVTGNRNSCGNGNVTCTAPNLGILLGNGDGTFTPAAGVSTLPATSTASVAIGDFNGDGKPDLLESENGNSGVGAVRVVPGNGNGTFGTAINIPTGQTQNPFGVAVGDFNGDGKLDLVGTNFQGTVGVALNQGTAGAPISGSTFGTVNGYGSNTAFPQSVAAAKLDGSTTVADLAFTQSTQFCSPLPCTQTDAVSILLNQGGGVFNGTQFNLTPGQFPVAVVAGRFRNAGGAGGGPGLDLAVANAGSNNISIFLNNGDTTGVSPFSATADHTYSVGVGTNPQAIAMGDFNNDGNLDLVVANAGPNNCNGTCPPNTISVFLGIGDGSFAAAKEFAVSGSPTAVGVGDFNGDGFPDIAVADQNSNAVTILLNTSGSLVSLASSVNPSTYGGAVTFTATVTPRVGNGTPTGTVTFFDNGLTISSGTVGAGGKATFTTGALAAGSHPITAGYSGDSNFAAGVSPVVSQVVNKAGTTLMITNSSANPSLTGTPVTFTATLSTTSPAGIASVNGETVTFFDGATSLGTGTLSASGVATSPATTFTVAGPHTITAVYAGDANFNGFTSPPFDQTVNASGVTPTTTAFTSVTVSQPTPGEPANTVHLKQTVSFRVQVSTVAGNPTGSVALQDNGVEIGAPVPLPGNSSTQTVNFGPFQLSVGVHNITANYFGDLTFAPSTGSAAINHTPKPR